MAGRHVPALVAIGSRRGPLATLGIVRIVAAAQARDRRPTRRTRRQPSHAGSAALLRRVAPTRPRVAEGANSAGSARDQLPGKRGQRRRRRPERLSDRRPVHRLRRSGPRPPPMPRRRLQPPVDLLGCCWTRACGAPSTQPRGRELKWPRRQPARGDQESHSWGSAGAVPADRCSGATVTHPAIGDAH